MEINLTLSDWAGVLLWAGIFFVPMMLFVVVFALPGNANRHGLKPKKPGLFKPFIKKAAIIALVISLALSAGLAISIKASTGISGDHSEST